jgi:hypothetical protein
MVHAAWPRAATVAKLNLLMPTLRASSAVQADSAAADVQATCSDPSRTVSHPVLFLLRSDATSMYHHWEDPVHLLLALAAAPELQAAVMRQGLQVRWARAALSMATALPRRPPPAAPHGPCCPRTAQPEPGQPLAAVTKPLA